MMEYQSWETAIQALAHIFVISLDIAALDMVPFSQGIKVWIRLFGQASVLPAKIERLCQLIGQGDVLDQSTEERIWREAREFEWVPANWLLYKIPIIPSRISAWEQTIREAFAPEVSLTHYSGAGQVCWLATTIKADLLAALLAAHDLASLCVLGQAGTVLLGNYPGRPFYRRVKAAMDPLQRFREL
jgi:hypothetical protein